MGAHDELVAMVDTGRRSSVGRRSTTLTLAAVALVGLGAGVGSIAWFTGGSPERNRLIATDTPTVTDSPDSAAATPTMATDGAQPTSGSTGEATDTSAGAASSEVASPTNEPPTGQLDDASALEPWRTLPPIVPERAFPAIVGGGDQIFLWGGWVPEHADGSQPPFDSGLILDTDRAAWREVAPSPLRGGGASATWTGSSVLVLSQGEVAEYSPANDTWATISGRAPQEQPLVTIDGRVYFPRDGFVWHAGTRQWIDNIAPLPTDSWGTPPWDSVEVLAAERSLVAIISEPEAHRVWTYDTTTTTAVAVAGWAEIATLPRPLR